MGNPMTMPVRSLNALVDNTRIGCSSLISPAGTSEEGALTDGPFAIPVTYNRRSLR